MFIYAEKVWKDSFILNCKGYTTDFIFFTISSKFHPDMHGFSERQFWGRPWTENGDLLATVNISAVLDYCLII